MPEQPRLDKESREVWDRRDLFPDKDSVPYPAQKSHGFFVENLLIIYESCFPVKAHFVRSSKIRPNQRMVYGPRASTFTVSDVAVTDRPSMVTM